MPEQVELALAEAHRNDWSRVVGMLVRTTRDLDLAEDAAQDAFLAALDAWRRDGIPDSTTAWLMTTARRKALDRIRRQASFARKLPLLIAPGDDADDAPVAEHLPDDPLRLIFTCCHPALSLEARVALALRLVCGLETATIARLFVVPLPTMAARITRAKKKIAMAGIAYRVPGPAELPERLTAVLSTVYLLFTAGHTVPVGVHLIAPALTTHALHLGRMLAHLLPGEPEVLGLVALMTLSESRRAVRLDGQGRLVRLEEQDRSRWDRSLIGEGIGLVEQSLTLSQGRLPGTYALQAAIEAVHAEASHPGDTDWPQLLALYDVLMTVAPSPVVALGRAVVIGRVYGPESCMRALDSLRAWDRDRRYYLYAAARAETLLALGRADEAHRAFRDAMNRTGNAIEREYLASRADALLGAPARPEHPLDT